MGITNWIASSVIGQSPSPFTVYPTLNYLNYIYTCNIFTAPITFHTHSDVPDQCLTK